MGGAEAALLVPPSDVAVAQAGGSPREDCGRKEEDSRRSWNMVLSLLKGRKIRQSGNCKALGCPKRGAALHSRCGTDSARTGASAECDTELNDAKGGFASEIGLCVRTFGGAWDGRGGSSDAMSGTEPSPALLSRSA